MATSSHAPFRGRLGPPVDADIARVVLVHRLREVVAQVGFTRFESAAPDIEGELDIGVRRASLAREIIVASGLREQRRRRFPPVQNGSDSVNGSRDRLSETVDNSSVPDSTAGQGASGHQSPIPGPAIFHAAFFLPPADHGGGAGMRLSGQFDPRTHLRNPGHRIWRPALHRHLRRRGHAGRAGSGGPPNPRACPQRSWISASCARTIRFARNMNRKAPTNAASCTALRVTAAC